MKKILLSSLLMSSILMAGGYRVPEVSLNAVALSSANVAHASGADTSYYNPANMVFMEDRHVTENDLTYVGLSSINFKGTGVDIDGDKENFFLPSFHYVSADVDGARYGLSIVASAGLTKRWGESPAVESAKEFTLQVVEVNPTVALPLNDKLSFAVGIRGIHSYGIVQAVPLAGVVSQELKGDSIDFGYNLALAYKPTKELEFGLTYRSKVDLSVKGDANLKHLGFGINGNYDANVEVPIPAILNVAVAYTFPTDTTVEFVYDRTYWSTYSEIDFNYSNATVEAIFGNPQPKKWKDVSSYRLGITQKLDDITLMCGIVIDETPVPEETLSYELPDSDLIAYSLGGRYQFNEDLNLGASVLYAPRDDRKVSNAHINGEFSNTGALLVSLGFEYKF